MGKIRRLLRQVSVPLVVALVIVAGAVIRGEQVGRNADRAYDAAVEAREAAQKAEAAAEKADNRLADAIAASQQGGIDQQAVAAALQEIHEVLLIVQEIRDTQGDQP